MSNIDEIRGRKHCYGVQAERDIDALLLRLDEVLADRSTAREHLQRERDRADALRQELDALRSVDNDAAGALCLAVEAHQSTLDQDVMDVMQAGAREIRAMAQERDKLLRTIAEHVTVREEYYGRLGAWESAAQADGYPCDDPACLEEVCKMARGVERQK